VNVTYIQKLRSSNMLTSSNQFSWRPFTGAVKVISIQQHSNGDIEKESITSNYIQLVSIATESISIATPTQNHVEPIK